MHNIELLHADAIAAVKSMGDDRIQKGDVMVLIGIGAVGAGNDPTIATHKGRIVKTTSDGLLVEFGSARVGRAIWGIPIYDFAGGFPAWKAAGYLVAVSYSWEWWQIVFTCALVLSALVSAIVCGCYVLAKTFPCGLRSKRSYNRHNWSRRRPGDPDRQCLGQ